MKSMMQLSLAETGFLPKTGKQTRKAEFLAEMKTMVAWSLLEALIEPFYPKKGNDRPPMPLSTMRRFTGQDAFENVMPDESTILRFHHLREKLDLVVPIFAEVNSVLSEKGLSMKGWHGSPGQIHCGAQFDEE